MDRFRNAEGMAHTSKLVSVGAGSTEKVLQDFGKDLSATQNELRTANAKAKSQRRSARRAEGGAQRGGAAALGRVRIAGAAALGLRPRFWFWLDSRRESVLVAFTP